MSTLPTNYVDAVLNADVNTRRKYNMIKNSDGTVSFEDVTDYTTNGSNFGADDINETNGMVNQLNNDLNDFSFRLNNGKPEYSTDDGTTWNKLGGDSMPLLDFDNGVLLDASNYTSTKNGAVVGTLSNNNTLYINDTAYLFEANLNQTDNIYMHGVPSGTKLKLSSAQGANQPIRFVPYLDD